MIEPLFDRCQLCGERSYKEGAGLCLRHELEGLIALSYEHMLKRAKRNPMQPRRITSNGIKRLQMTAIREIRPTKGK